MSSALDYGSIDAFLEERRRRLAEDHREYREHAWFWKMGPTLSWGKPPSLFLFDGPEAFERARASADASEIPSADDGFAIRCAATLVNIVSDSPDASLRRLYGSDFSRDLAALVRTFVDGPPLSQFDLRHARRDGFERSAGPGSWARALALLESSEILSASAAARPAPPRSL